MEEGAVQRKKATERRSVILMVRLTPDEQTQVEDSARQSGLPVATYIRTVILGRRLAPVVPQVNFDAIDQLRRIGNNLNQAVVAIYTRSLSPSLRPPLLELVTLVRKLRAELAGKLAVDYERNAVAQPANDPDLTDDPNLDHDPNSADDSRAEAP